MADPAAGVSWRLAQTTWPEAERHGDATLLVPLGSTEQHGPHLPLETDTRIAVALCERVAARRRATLVCPAVPYGASGEHQDFPGTLSIGTGALAQLLVELCRSALGPCESAVLVNGHGGNADALARALDALQQEGRSVAVWSPRWSVADRDDRADAHAGRTETSLMLAIAPELVRLDLAEAGNTEPIGDLGHELRRSGVRAVSANGVLGDPEGATADHGFELLDRAVEELTSFLDAPARLAGESGGRDQPLDIGDAAPTETL